MRLILVAALLFAASSGSISAAVPREISRQLPSGYAVLTSAEASVGGRTFYLIALRSRKELDSRSYLGHLDRAPKRPLIIFERTKHGIMQFARNDDVIDRAGDAGLAGNGCDPFEDGKITVKGPYFTVENGVSCGAHWTDVVTFRFDPRLGYVFDNRRFQSWKLNPSDDPNAQALIPDAQELKRASKGQPVLFSQWRSPR